MLRDKRQLRNLKIMATLKMMEYIYPWSVSREIRSMLRLFKNLLIYTKKIMVLKIIPQDFQSASTVSRIRKTTN